jgi:hypothetical protein
MIDIEETATRAIASPIAPPPEMARVETLAGRYRRRRAVLGATTAAAFVVLVVVIAAALISPSGDERVKVTVASPSSTASVPSSTPTAPTTFADLVARLKVDHEVVRQGTTPGSLGLRAPAHLLCVDGTRVSVYEYRDRAARAAVSEGISPDGDQLVSPPDSNGNVTMTLPHWIGPPHFFASGRIIVLVLTDDAPLLGWMTGVLGPTLSPEARPGATRDACKDSAPTIKP